MANAFDWFLRAKHWQVFLLFVGPLILALPLAFLVLFVSGMFRVHSLEDLPSAMAAASTAAAIIGFASYFAWIWSAGAFLNSVARDELKHDPKVFRFTVVGGAAILVLAELTQFLLLKFTDTAEATAAISAVFVPVYLCAAVCFLYNFYFVARALVSAERGEGIASKWSQWFFLIWIFPLGIWFIQPKINRLYAGQVRTMGSRHLAESPSS